ncbi:hypothetical protein SAMN05216228_103712 [Rhizobium tibeticum]|uniref:Uncharacterized protein n=1 Tax=Rhizobium tibeticum TaxID=501024 RepID=A0A1H8UX56_9HYPH|nr:hypothetical protein [Rhizobium tibeticum]SEI18066.1 hypothetical protein RTCCBAU85039_5773 [Rhizobium tibeticum]SEP07726.1 hypothetical protein SAMN05216228_103712 [Rhizobium tibeticum]
MTEFQDIRIVELNDAASGLSNEGPLTSMVLRLSADAPDPWSTTFNEAWQSHGGMMKRKAMATRDSITSLCMPYELQGQILELNKVIDETNTSYRSMLSQAASQSYGVVDARRELNDLKNSLTYE